LQDDLLVTSIKYGSDHGVREYDVTKVYPEGDTIVFDVVKQSGLPEESANPDKIIIRELTGQEKEYLDKVEKQNLSFMVDRRNELS
jgi:hypothetical protein